MSGSQNFTGNSRCVHVNVRIVVVELKSSIETLVDDTIDGKNTTAHRLIPPPYIKIQTIVLFLYMVGEVTKPWRTKEHQEKEDSSS